MGKKEGHGRRHLILYTEKVFIEREVSDSMSVDV
jgi:hypothetical protein